MNFFDWLYKTLQKKLLQSYNEYWQHLCQYFRLQGGKAQSDIHNAGCLIGFAWGVIWVGSGPGNAGRE